MRALYLHVLLLVGLVEAPFIVFSQVGDYQFSQSFRNYSALSDGTTIADFIDLTPTSQPFTQPALLSGSTTTTGATASGEGFPIGFNFTYNGEVFDRFSFSTNGYIRLGKSTAACTISQFTAAGDFLNRTDEAAANIIAPFQGNLNLSGYVTYAGYITSGVPGRRGLCVSWIHQNNSRYPDYIAYMAILYESSNVIEFLYQSGPYKGSALQATIGFKGDATVNDFTNIRLRKITNGINTWETSAEGTSLTDRCDYTTTFKTIANYFLVFSWTPPESMKVPYPCPTYFFLDNTTSSAYISDLVRPADQVTDVGLNPTLYWSGFLNIPTTYDVYFGTDNPPVELVSQNQTSTQYTTPLLAPGVDYYYKVVAKNADTVVDNCMATFRTGQTLVTCAPRVYGGSTHIKNISFNTLSYTRTEATAAIFEFPATGTYTTSLKRNSAYNFSYTYNGSTLGYKYGVYVFIDFNQDADFDDAGERFDIGVVPATGTNYALPAKSIDIPVTALLGATKMRVRVIQTLDTVNPTACGEYPSGQATQEYTITIVPATGCESFSVSYNTTNVDCFNNHTGAIDLTVSGGSTPYTFAWSGEASATEDRSALPRGTYQATVTDHTGCTVATPRIAITQPAAVGKPVITVNGALTFCEGSNVTLSAPAGFTTYEWSTGSNQQEVSIDEAGSYTLKVKNASGCESPLSDAVAVTTLERPAAPQQILFILPDTLKAIGTASHYEWRLNSTLLTESTASIKAKEPGEYVVKTVSEAGCISSGGASYTYSITGLEQDEANSFIIYPNPSAGTFHIMSKQYTGEAVITGYNALGDVVFYQSNTLTSEMELNLPGLPDGIYTLVIRHNAGEIARKIVVLH